MAPLPAVLPTALRLSDERMPDEEWWQWGGLSVHVDRYAADGRGKVLLLHGAGGYGRLLSLVGVALRDSGFEVVAPDMPGYGLTRAPARQNNWGPWVRLVRELVSAERDRDGRPVTLFGASIGGPLAYHACGAPEVEVAGLIATMLLDPREPRRRAVLGPPWAPKGDRPAPGQSPRDRPAPPADRVREQHEGDRERP